MQNIDMKYYFVRSIVNDGKISLKYRSMEMMAADVMSKPATKCKLFKFAELMFGS